MMIAEVKSESARAAASQLPALGREVNGHSHRMFCSLLLAMSIYGHGRRWMDEL